MIEDHRSPLHHGLDDLQAKIIRLAWTTGEVVTRSTNALLLSDLFEAQLIIDADDDTDLLSVEIEELCFELLVLQSPLARDLRLVVASMKINSDLERAADLMVNIAKATRRLHGTVIPPKLRGQIRLMGDEAAKLLRFSIDAYARQDGALGAAVRDIDDTLDRLHREFVSAIFESHAATDLGLQVAVQLALIGRFYERVGDHAVNVGEWAEFVADGHRPEHRGAVRAREKQRLAQAALDPMNTDAANNE